MTPRHGGADGGADDDAGAERIVTLLRQRGLRVTAARRAVLDALLADAHHASADAVARRVQAEHPEVHLSTVYRTLDALERLGVITHVHLGHGRALYHLTDELHHHAVCDACGAVTELPADLFDELRGRLAHDFGFDADPHHFALVGRCRRCRAAPGGAAG